MLVNVKDNSVHWGYPPPSKTLSLFFTKPPLKSANQVHSFLGNPLGFSWTSLKLKERKELKT